MTLEERAEKVVEHLYSMQGARNLYHVVLEHLRDAACVGVPTDVAERNRIARKMRRRAKILSGAEPEVALAFREFATELEGVTETAQADHEAA